MSSNGSQLISQETSLTEGSASSELFPEALREALGYVIAEARRDWQRDHELALTQVREIAAHSREIIANMNTQIVELRQQMSEQITARLAELKDGPAGKNGTDGSIGSAGPDGPVGPVGEKGEIGPVGPAGTAGLPGESIVGPRGERGLIGPRGDKGDSIIGPIGPQGEKGDPGQSVTGPAGARGAPGETGMKGDKGDVGERGEKGDIGEAGLPGFAGERGERGDKGETGERGIDGAAGPVGEQGPIGAPGEKGAQGEKGISGESIIGPRGERGERGESIVGPVGATGQRGERGERGETGFLTAAKEWKSGKVFYKGNVVTHAGGTFQAQRDTSHEPGSHIDWVCLAAGGSDGTAGRDGIDGRSFTVRDTYDANESYKELDVVTLNSTWFVARKDSPGPCPGPDWKAGPVGRRGEKGERGERGVVGARGEPGIDGREIIGWELDRKNYAIVPLMSDGKNGPPVNVRSLFEQFQMETG
jgi:hypothetical protein